MEQALHAGSTHVQQHRPACGARLCFKGAQFAQPFFRSISLRHVPVYHILQGGGKDAGKDIRFELAAAGLRAVLQIIGMRLIRRQQKKVARDE